MAPEIRSVGPDDLAELHRVVETAFGGDVTPERTEVEGISVEYDRWIGVADGGALVASAGAYTFDLTLPGLGAIPVAGVTWVGVLPTHRRRGILKQIMAHQLDDVVSRGEPVAVLTASEAVIYGRFGYGPATWAVEAAVPTERAAFVAPPAAGGRCRLVWDDERAKAIPAVYDAWHALRPGSTGRPETFWRTWFTDAKHHRKGASKLFAAVHEDERGVADGYAMWRVKQDDPEADDRNTVRVLEVVAVDPEVEATLHRFLLDLDLTARVSYRAQPIDDPLRQRLADVRAYQAQAGTYDWLWVRLLDLPAALEARRYATRGTVVFDVADRFRPNGAAVGRFRLDGGPDGAAVTRLDAAGPEPDVVLPVESLGAAYLGGTSFRALGLARRANGTPEGIARADALFACVPAPYCNTPF